MPNQLEFDAEPTTQETPRCSTPPREGSAVWYLPPRRPEFETLLQHELGIGAPLAAVLAARGFESVVEVDAFLNPKLDELHDPHLLPDYEAAARAILGAIERREKIFVHGDYDVDGVTSAAIFHRFFTSLGAHAHVHVPHRIREGYGINLDAVEAAKEFGARLFLTCDCGTSAYEQVEHARQAGMTVVVTDHHEVAGELPSADAVVNPHRPDSKYPFLHLSGAGVVFKLLMGISEQLGVSRERFTRAFIDLAALGTVVDLMELSGENRVIGRFGLEAIPQTKKIGLKAMLDESGLTERLKTRPMEGMDLGFGLGPRLNAAGRIDDAALALELLTTEDEARARLLANKIEQLNLHRRERQEHMVREVVERVSELPSLPSFIVIGSENWHRGIVGIVAGKVVSEFFRPALVVSIDPETGHCHGSARSIPLFNVAEAIRAYPDLMSGGGHAAAAGCSFALDNLKEVQEALHQFATQNLQPEQLIRREYFDADLDPEEFTPDNVEELSRLEPCGMGNPRPRFAARGMKITKSQLTRDGKHVQLWVQRGKGKIVKGIYFGAAEHFEALSAGNVVDLAISPGVSSYRGRDVEWRVSAWNAPQS